MKKTSIILISIFIFFIISGIIFKAVYFSINLADLSMAPALNAADTTRFKRFFSHPLNRSTVVAYTRNNQTYVARVIALPGEKYSLNSGNVYINGDILEEVYVEDKGEYNVIVDEFSVPENSYIVMVDWRPRDPAMYHLVTFDNVLGVLVN